MDNATVKVIGACGITHQDIQDAIATLAKRATMLEDVPTTILMELEDADHL